MSVSEEIYTDDDFGIRVRNIISTTEDLFSDDVISSYDFKGLAEVTTKKKIPLWSNILGGDNEDYIELLKTCVVIQTALFLAPNVKKEQIKVQQTTHAKVEYFENSAYDILLEGLSERLAMLILELNGEDYNGFSAVAITNPDKRFYGAGFDVL